MRGWWQIGWICGVAFACDEPAPSVEEPRVARGDRIVIELRAGQFLEGRALEVKEQRVRVQTKGGDDLLEVALGDVYVVTGSRPAIGAGSIGICNTEAEHWHGCQVESLEAGSDRARIVILEGRRLGISIDAMIAPTEVTRLNLERAFAEARSRGAFEAQARRAGSPDKPENWRPRHESRVLGRRNGEWFLGRVVEEAAEGAIVSWPTRGDASRIGLSALAPLPPYTDATFLVGGFALMAPEANGDPWPFVRISAIADGHATVVDREGKRSKRLLRDLVPLSH